MPLTDPIADLLTRIRNAQHARRTECRVPWSGIKQSICELLKSEGFVGEVSVDGEGFKKEITVAFLEDKPKLTLKRISSPGSRRYASVNGVRPILHGASIAILSTSQGLLTHQEAKKRGIGGEIICTIS